MNWKVTAKDKNCVDILIYDNIPLEMSKIKVLSDTRSLLLEIIPTNDLTSFCLYTGKPMFVELHTDKGVFVKYVEKSGSEYYKKLIK
jgi:hypothetical protein